MFVVLLLPYPLVNESYPLVNLSYFVLKLYYYKELAKIIIIIMSYTVIDLRLVLLLNKI